jgi:broad specificity phosphatase PhoE
VNSEVPRTSSGSNPVGPAKLTYYHFCGNLALMNELEVRFIRHAEGSHMLNPALIAGRSMDAVLTERGKSEADQKGLELAADGTFPDAVFSSPAQRCVQTSNRILGAMGMTTEIIITDALIEMDQGDYVGKLRSEVYDQEVQKQILERGKDFALPGGESMNQVGGRGLNWLKEQEIHAVKTRLTLFAIAHAGLITHTVGAIENWDHATSLKMLRSMPPVGETVIIFDGAEWHVQSFARPLQD